MNLTERGLRCGGGGALMWVAESRDRWRALVDRATQLPSSVQSEEFLEQLSNC
jgi:hypothetical protein